MMFADDIAICSESREQVEENLERWRFALERRGMKVSRSKTEYMCVNEREGSGTVRLQGEEVKKVQEFKYLGSTVQSNGECGKEVKKRVQAGWNGWRMMSGVLCDRKISAGIKGKVYKTVVRPAMVYGLETVSLRKRQESELEVAELKMLRFSLGVTREQVEENLERWRFALERRGMKVSRSKTEYMCVNEREGSGTVRLQGEEVKKVQEFKYLGSTVQSTGECGKEVKKRVQAGWNGWRKVSGVLCDRKISARIKGKVYKTVVRLAMLYGLETVALRKRQESELEVAELKMLRFSLGVTREGSGTVRLQGEEVKKVQEFKYLGSTIQSDGECGKEVKKRVQAGWNGWRKVSGVLCDRKISARIKGKVYKTVVRPAMLYGLETVSLRKRQESELEVAELKIHMELPGRRQRGRPKRRYMEVINEDMKLVGASVEDAEDRDRWRVMIRCGDP
ncbi:hypothetical protein PGIGA_G00049960 [Pangasianodon gigas]|uniref:Uncharacterized protein n=1 Tax=Pangasianodon gigas TaxID=30993 RepID=A0ACC5X2M1_PANGG|nr:hypothetical protein [Pangasianodon gigas]